MNNLRIRISYSVLFQILNRKKEENKIVFKQCNLAKNYLKKIKKSLLSEFTFNI